MPSTPDNSFSIGTDGPQDPPDNLASDGTTGTAALPAVELDDSSHAALRTQAGFESLSPKFVVFEKRTNLMAAAVVLVIAAGILFPWVWFTFGRVWVLGLATACWTLAAASLIAAAVLWPPLAYRHTNWRINQEGMEIRRGVFWRHRVSIPVARVQHVDVSQGPVARMFDLGKLTIHTAGTRNASVELDGLHHARALQVRDQLIRQKESLDVL